MSGTTEFVADRLAVVLLTGKYFDVEFLLTNGDKIKGHKLIFSIASPVFEAILHSGPTEKRNVTIMDIEPHVFKSITEFIYSDKVKLESLRHAVSIYKGANQYKILRLQKLTEEYICSNIRMHDVLELFELAELYNSSSIKNICLQIIQNETESIFKSNQLLGCSLSTLAAITDQDRLNISEVELFNAVEKWVFNITGKNDVNMDSLLPMLRIVITKIRFLSMDVDSFLKFPYRSQLLSAEEKHSILVNLNRAGKVPLPGGLSNCATPRWDVCCRYHNLMVDSSLGSVWHALKLRDCVSSFNSNNLQVMQKNNEGESRNKVVESLIRPIVFEYLLSHGFKPSCKISFAGVVLNAPESFQIDFLIKNRSSSGYARRQTVHGDNVDIAFHFNPRFNNGVIVRNTKTDFNWHGREERDGPFVFRAGSPFVIDIYCLEETFQVVINGSVHSYYAHRVNPSLITHVAVGGCVDVHAAAYYHNQGNQTKYEKVSKNPIPRNKIFESLLSGGFQPFSRISFTGVVLDAPDRFRIDFLIKNQINHRALEGTAPAHESEVEIAFHFNPRFDSRVIVRNSTTNFRWNDQEEREGLFLFSTGSTFVIDFYCQEENFKVVINDSVHSYYRHRVNPNLITHVLLSGCFDVQKAVYYSNKGSWQTFTAKDL